MTFKIFHAPDEPAGGTPPAAPAAPPAGGEAPPAAPPAAPGGTPPLDTTIPPGETPPPAEGSDFSKMRDSLTDEALQKQAAQYNSFEDMVKSNLKMRQKGTEQGFKVPEKDADPQEVADFRKALGVPEDVGDYEFPAIPEGTDKEEGEKARGKWGKVFQDANVSTEGAKMLIEALQEDANEIAQSETAADKDFADECNEILAQEWGKDYDANKNFANKAITELFGTTLEDVKYIETKDGKFIMDHPAFVMAFSKVGREMTEGGLGEAVTPEQRQGARDQANSARDKRVAAQASGNTKEAQYWDEKEREALALMEKPQPLVGTEGRVL